MDFTDTNIEKVDVLFSGSRTVAAGTVGDVYTTNTYDMRAYSSYYLTVTAQRAAAPTGFNRVVIAPQFMDLSGVDLYDDFYEVYANQINPYMCYGGRFQIQDQVHGPQLVVKLQRVTAPNAIDLTIKLQGTTRNFGSPYVRCDDLDFATDEILIHETVTIANGAARNVGAMFGYGPARFRIYNAGPGALTYYAYYGSYGSSGSAGFFDSSTVAAGTLNVVQYTLGKRAVNWYMTAAGGACTVTTQLVRSLSPV